MPVAQTLDFDLEDLPMDIFDLIDTGIQAESLTEGQGQIGACCINSTYACVWFSS